MTFQMPGKNSTIVVIERGGRRKILIRVLAYPYFFELWVRGTPTFLPISRVFVTPRLAHPSHAQPLKSENLKASEKNQTITKPPSTIYYPIHVGDMPGSGTPRAGILRLHMGEVYQIQIPQLFKFCLIFFRLKNND